MQALLTKRSHVVAARRGPSILEIEHHVPSWHLQHRTGCDACIESTCGRWEGTRDGLWFFEAWWHGRWRWIWRSCPKQTAHLGCQRGVKRTISPCNLSANVMDGCPYCIDLVIAERGDPSIVALETATLLEHHLSNRFCVNAQLAGMPPMVLLSLPCAKWRGRHERWNLLWERKWEYRRLTFHHWHQVRSVSSGSAERWFEGWNATFWTCLEEARCRVWGSVYDRPGGSKGSCNWDATKAVCWSVCWAPHTNGQQPHHDDRWCGESCRVSKYECWKPMPEEYKNIWNFLGDDATFMFPYAALSLVRRLDTRTCVSLRPFGCFFFPVFSTRRWTPDPEVDSSPSLLVWRSVYSWCLRWRMWVSLR